jgi:hypothetical protein
MRTLADDRWPSPVAVVLLSVFLGCAGGSGPKTEASVAPDVDLAAYSTFSVSSTTPREQPLSILDARVRDAVRSELVSKGYQEVEEGPDLEVTFDTADYVEEKTKGSPMRIGVGIGSWGGNVGGGVGTSMPVGSERVVAEHETRITLRAVDPRANREVWVGTAAGLAGGDLASGEVEKAVARTLADFPSKRP